ncbi:MAG TPA: hypothetical protein VFX96_13120 [Pyrinomonadaceae bacterium]|nr:hypothetical protein [Pyrinomonadaceae bacterium]
MEDLSRPTPKPPETTHQTSGLTPFLIGSSILFLAVACFCAYKGYTTLYDDSYNAKVVGGDAYNFIIYAGRGTAMVCIGIISALIGVAFSVFAAIDKLRQLAENARAAKH